MEGRDNFVSGLNDENSASSDDVRTKCAATQCGSAVLKEDSNVVTPKSWSDDEDTDEDNATKTVEGSQDVDSENQAKDDKEDILQVNGSKRKAEDTLGPSTKKTKHSKEQDSVKSNDDLKEVVSDSKIMKRARYESELERFSETSYYFDNGLRKVYPYNYTFKSFAKGRWVGRKILDVYSKEFRAQSSEEYEARLKAGTLTVNGKKVDSDYVLKHNDLIANVVHRHEVPVTADPIDIIHMDKDIVVINKPASIPVHPCGRYRHNTVVFILAKEYNLKDLRTVHRLDRLTSGILIFCRTANRARELEYHIRSRHVAKEYVCRVEGNFPDNEIECNEPIEVVSYKIGVCRVSPNGKECSTTIKKLGYDSKTNSSILLCRPHTGRMHQIRVHLQYLGYPIVRDPLYNHPVFGPEKGKNGNIGKTNEELIQELIHLHNAENWFDGEVNLKLQVRNPPASLQTEEKVSTEFHLSNESVVNQEKKNTSCQTNYDEPDPCLKPHKMIKIENCSECKINYRDPEPSDMRMYLHALSYQGPDWAYKTRLPVWADPDWEERF